MDNDMRNSHLIRVPGHFGELMSNDYWSFLKDICENYGGAVKLQGLLGVRSFSDAASIKHN